MQRILRIVITTMTTIVMATSNMPVSFAATTLSGNNNNNNTNATQGWDGKCIPQSELYEEQQAVLHYKCCQNSTTNKAAATPTTASSTAVGGGGCGNNVNGDKDNRNQVWSFLNNMFKSKGYTDDEAKMASAGIMGNWQQESAFNSYRTDGTGCAGNDKYGINGWGLAQWCGDRVANLKSFAAEKRTEWTCLGSQLEFVQHEMETSFPQLYTEMKGKSPAEAAALYDRIFEGSEGSGDRPGKATALYQELTGQSVDSLAASGTASGGANQDECSTSGSQTPSSGQSSSPIPGADCATLVPQVKQLLKDGKFRSINGDANLNNDLSNCTDNPLSCGTGVTPELLRAFVAVVNDVDSKGLGQVEIASMNTGHPCGTANGKSAHDVGRAVDFWNCYDLDSDPKCKEIFTYIANNADQLGVKQVIHDKPPTGYTCGQGKVTCLSDHNNEIHMGL